MRSAWFAIGLVGLSGQVLAQGPLTDRVQLQLRLVSQVGTPSNPASPVHSFDTMFHPDMSSPLGSPRRVEVQYRLVDLDTNDAFNPAGLASGNMRIVATGATLERAILSRFEARNPTAGSPALPPASTSVNLDTDNSVISGNATIGSFRGLHAPYRGGIPVPAPNNDSPANGVFSADSTVLSGINPLSLTQTDQNDGGWYGLYSFNFFPTRIVYSVTVTMDADPITGERFRFFGDGEPVPFGGTLATGDTITSIPAPGWAGILTLSSLFVMRRRR